MFEMWLCAGPTAEVPLYGVAAAQRCLEEFDSLLEHAGTFGSEAWQEARRLFDVHRIANMLLAQDDIGLRLTGVPSQLICLRFLSTGLFGGARCMTWHSREVHGSNMVAKKSIHTDSRLIDDSLAHKCVKHHRLLDIVTESDCREHAWARSYLLRRSTSSHPQL